MSRRTAKVANEGRHDGILDLIRPWRLTHSGGHRHQDQPLVHQPMWNDTRWSVQQEGAHPLRIWVASYHQAASAPLVISCPVPSFSIFSPLKAQASPALVAFIKKRLFPRASRYMTVCVANGVRVEALQIKVGLYRERFQRVLGIVSNGYVVGYSRYRVLDAVWGRARAGRDLRGRKR